jgi:hypothetical protein
MVALSELDIRLVAVIPGCAAVAITGDPDRSSRRCNSRVNRRFASLDCSYPPDPLPYRRVCQLRSSRSIVADRWALLATVTTRPEIWGSSKLVSAK